VLTPEQTRKRLRLLGLAQMDTRDVDEDAAGAPLTLTQEQREAYAVRRLANISGVGHP
jgi:hypothetical protein